jgi:hypothetical protein
VVDEAVFVGKNGKKSKVWQKYPNRWRCFVMVKFGVLFEVRTEFLNNI